MAQVPASILTLIAGVLITLISLWVGQNHGLMPEQASEQAPLVDNFFNLMVTIATALFLAVQGAIVIFIIKYRKRAGDESDGIPIEGNFSLEVVLTAIPALIVIALGIYSVEVYQQMGGFAPSAGMMAHAHSAPVAHTSTAKPGSAIAAPLLAQAGDTAATAETSAVADAYKLPVYGFGATPDEKGQKPDLTVDVTGLQFAWLFNYVDNGVTSGELHVPVGKVVQLNITAQDVIHSFWVPQFRLKQDALPGEKSQLRFVATKTGTFPIVCAELCGSYHGSMRTQVVVHPTEEYQQWLQENQVAQAANLSQSVAVKPADLPVSEFLAPYAHEMGVEAAALQHLQPEHHHS